MVLCTVWENLLLISRVQLWPRSKLNQHYIYIYRYIHRYVYRYIFIHVQYVRYVQYECNQYQVYIESNLRSKS